MAYCSCGETFRIIDMQKIKDWFVNVFLPLWRAMWKHPIILFIVKWVKKFWDFIGGEELLLIFPLLVFVLWALVTKGFVPITCMLVQGLMVAKYVITRCTK